MQFHRRFYISAFTIIFVFTLAWDAWLYALPNHTSVWNYIFNVMYGSIYFLGGVVGVMHAFEFGLKSNLGKMLLFLGLGMLSFWVGNIIWAYYTMILMVPVPYPSAADYAYFFIYPFLAIGVWYMMQLYQRQITTRLVFDSCVIIVVSFVIIFGFFARPDVSATLPFMQKFTNVYYPVSDMIISSIALIVLRIGGGKTHPSLFIFTFGMVMMTVADLLFTYRNAVFIYWNGDISDLFYTFSAYLLSIGVVEIIASLYNSTTAETSQSGA